MAPIIHCVRHAQGFHNLGEEYHQLRDPRLTPLGEEQCEALTTVRFSDQSRLSLVVASPLTRTLQTALLTFEPALKGPKCAKEVLAIPDLQEISDYPCDTGSELHTLKTLCAKNGWPVDLSLVRADWTDKAEGSRYFRAAGAIQARAQDARVLIREKVRELVANGDPNPEVAVITHGAFLHFFTGDWENADKYSGTGWANTELRSYEYDLGINSDDKNATLIETSEGREQRGVRDPPSDQEAQERFFKEAMDLWTARTGLPLKQ